MPILTDALKLLLSSMILLCSMFSGMKIQWQMIWHSKHKVFNQIEAYSIFWKNLMFRFAKPDSPAFGRCVVQQSVLLNQVQQNQMVRFLKPEDPEFLGFWTNQAK
jgi:hypothetical protein